MLNRLALDDKELDTCVTDGAPKSSTCTIASRDRCVNYSLGSDAVCPVSSWTGKTVVKVALGQT